MGQALMYNLYKKGKKKRASSDLGIRGKKHKSSCMWPKFLTLLLVFFGFQPYLIFVLELD